MTAAPQERKAPAARPGRRSFGSNSDPFMIAHNPAAHRLESVPLSFGPASLRSAPDRPL